MGSHTFQFCPIVVSLHFARGHYTQKIDVYIVRSAQKIPKFHLKNLSPPEKLAENWLKIHTVHPCGHVKIFLSAL